MITLLFHLFMGIIEEKIMTPEFFTWAVCTAIISLVAFPLAAADPVAGYITLIAGSGSVAALLH